MEQAKQIHSEQPFFVVEDAGYKRMMKKLKDGEKSVKTFLHGCPHRSKEDCKCEYFSSYLDEDGDMMRNVNGTIKPVISVTMLKNAIKKLGMSMRM